MALRPALEMADEKDEMMIAWNKCENSASSCFHNKLLKIAFSGCLFWQNNNQNFARLCLIFPRSFPRSAFVENINLFFIFYVRLCNPKFMFLVFPSTLPCKHFSHHLIQAFVIKFFLPLFTTFAFSPLSTAYGDGILQIYCVLYEGEASWKIGLILLYRAATSSIACCSNIAVNLNT